MPSYPIGTKLTFDDVKSIASIEGFEIGVFVRAIDFFNGYFHQVFKVVTPFADDVTLISSMGGSKCDGFLNRDNWGEDKMPKARRPMFSFPEVVKVPAAIMQSQYGDPND